MKSLVHKLLALTFVFALITGCASVTDAGLETQPEQPAVEQPQADSPVFSSDSEMDSAIRKPE